MHKNELTAEALTNLIAGSDTVRPFRSLLACGDD
jgi:hypothetical protein